MIHDHTVLLQEGHCSAPDPSFGTALGTERTGSEKILLERRQLLIPLTEINLPSVIKQGVMTANVKDHVGDFRSLGLA